MFYAVFSIMLADFYWKDGGGIRGLSSLFILENMMQKIKIMGDYEVEPLPCDYFDMICGTSTGGHAYINYKHKNCADIYRIIAIMLGRLRMPVSECIKAYLDMSEKVFGKPQTVAHRERFGPKALEDNIKAVVGRKTGDENASLLDPNCCKT